MNADFVMETSPLIHVEDLVKTFGENEKGKKTIHALNGVSMDIRKGDVVVIIGPSGSGKCRSLSDHGPFENRYTYLNNETTGPRRT